jgi:hypothetical protein
VLLSNSQRENREMTEQEPRFIAKLVYKDIYKTRRWNLIKIENQEVVGEINNFGYRKTFEVSINNPNTTFPFMFAEFPNIQEALTWAKKNIESLPAATIEEILVGIQSLEKMKRDLEYSDDFCFTNGKIDAINKRISILRGRASKIENYQT